MNKVKQNILDDSKVEFKEYKKGKYTYIQARVKVQMDESTSKWIMASAKSRFEARQRLQKAYEKAVGRFIGEKDKHGNGTLLEAIEAMLVERAEEFDHVKNREARRDSSVKRDRECIEALLKPYPVAQKKLSDITAADMGLYQKAVMQATYDSRRTNKPHEPVLKHYSSSTIDRALRLVKKALDEYYRFKDVKSPGEAIVQVKQSSKEKTTEDFLIGEEILRAMEYFRKKREEKEYPLDETCADFFICIILAGTRPGELAGAKVKDWNRQEKAISIRRTAGQEDGRTKTEGSMRKLILPEEAAEIMDRRTLEKDEEALIFSGTEGGLLSPSNYNKKLKRWLKEAGITKKLHTHSLRGTFGTFLLEHGVSMEDVSVILGHKQQRTTEKYYSTITDLRRTSASLIANEQFDMLTAFDRGAGAIV